MRWPTLVMVAMATLGAGALSFAEFGTVAHLQRRMGLKTWLRHTVLRSVSLSLLGIGLYELTAATAVVVWHDLDAFLMRTGQPLPPVDWMSSWLKVGAGLYLSALTLPPRAAAALGWFLAFAGPSQASVMVWLLPLQTGRSGWLLGVGAVTAVPAVAVAWCCARLAARRDPSDRSGPTVRNVCPSAAFLALVSTLFLSQAWIAWPVPKVNALLPSLLVSVYWLRTWSPEMAAQHRWPARLRTLGGGLLNGRRDAWTLLTALLCVWHWGCVLVAVPALATEGRRTLDRVTEWPQLLTGVEDPGPDRWEPVAERIRHTIALYDGHRWCGQWMLVLAWIETRHLQHPYTARIVLLSAARAYPRTIAKTPPFWLKGRTVREVAERMLDLWGPLVNPGSQPA